MPRNILMLLLLVMSNLLAYAQKTDDTIFNWRQKFAALGSTAYISDDGNWIGINKINDSSRDSSFIVGTKNKKVYKIHGTGPISFLNGTGVFGMKNEKLQYLNLIDGTTSMFSDVAKIYPLSDLHAFAILFKDHHLRLYDAAANLILELPDVNDLPITDSKKLLFIKKEINTGRQQIVKVSPDGEKVLDVTTNQIQKIELIQSDRLLAVTEKSTAKDHDELVALETDTGSKLLELHIPKRATAKFSEIQQGLAFLISARVPENEAQNSLVETWYGNDPYLNEHYKMYRDRKFWLWKPKKNQAQIIEVPKDYEVISLNNERYFLTYPPRKGHNYISSEPQLNDAKIYDSELHTLKDLGNLKLVKQEGKEWPVLSNSEIYCSPNGKKFVASADGIRWTLYDSNSQIEIVIGKEGLEEPVFSYSGELIYFGSGDDLWAFNIAKKELRPVGIGKGKSTKLVNTIFSRDGHITCSFLSTDKVLAEVYDKDRNEVSIVLLKGGKWHNIIPPTKNKISMSNVLFNPSMTSYYTLEENFNQPPALYSYRNGKQGTLLFDADIKDEGGTKIKQDIYSYYAVGKKLNGILYYPMDFNPQKKYPMVVRIYDMQRHLSNGYLSPNKTMPEGFQIRTLLERGYFVYLPDTTVEEKGPGVSALECVEKALDAVLENPNIDRSKIGLCGQSYGGYKTNFIATKTDRFAAYISGSGISDIISDFYSYNFSFIKPNYFIYNTIYQMNTAVAEDKDRFLKNSPILNVEDVNAPMLLWAGKNDTTVPWCQTTEFYMGLRRYNKDVIALFYPNGNHSFVNGTQEAQDLNTKVLDWWDYFLKDKRNKPWINTQMTKDAQ